jgi:DNA transformation protein
MSVSQEYSQYVLEQLSGLGRIISRRMFGGVGLYCDDLFFGLISGDALYFKVDDSNRADYVARGMEQFCPYRDQPDRGMAYYELPADALEDAEDCVRWARRALAVALAAANKPAAARKRAAAKTSAPARKRAVAGKTAAGKRPARPRK